MKVFVKFWRMCVIIDLKIDFNINRLCEKVVDYYDTRTSGEFVQIIWTLNTFSVWNMTDFFVIKIPGDVPSFEEQEVLDESLITLKSIFTLGEIYCHNSLDKYGIPYHNKKLNFNGYDYISICTDNPSNDEFTGNNFGLD